MASKLEEPKDWKRQLIQALEDCEALLKRSRQLLRESDPDNDPPRVS